jgi:hypothetical protein
MSVTVSVTNQTVEVTKDGQTVTVSPITQSVTISSPGPQGATGSQGSAGATGPQGPAGSSGVIAVNAPLTNSGSSTSANLSISAASTSASGVVQLSDSTSTTSSVLAATPTAVKAAYDFADLALTDAAFEAFNFGSAGTIGNKPKYVLTTTISATSGLIYHNEFTPHKNVTVGSISFTGASAATTPTLIRFGIYTRSGTTFTLVARTASDTTIFNGVNVKFTRALDTTGGYPATYTMTAGTTYWVSLIVVASGAPTILASVGRNPASQVTGASAYSQSSQSDLVATSTGSILTSSGGMYAEVS